jgi:hypothetical protein
MHAGSDRRHSRGQEGADRLLFAVKKTEHLSRNGDQHTEDGGALSNRRRPSQAFPKLAARMFGYCIRQGSYG